MNKTYHCPICKRAGMPYAAASRHIALAHKADSQIRCKCGVIAEFRNGKAQTRVCGEHTTRYSVCRWCSKPLETGQGIGSTCHCYSLGYLSDLWLEIKAAVEIGA